MSLFSQFEIESAFDKLRNYYYYEKIDLITRHKVFAWDRRKIASLTEEINDIDNDFNKYLKKIRLNPFPKSFIEKTKNHDENYFSNRNTLQNDPIKDFLVFIDAPIEIHIISILWTTNLGIVLDKQLGINCFGNRIYSNDIKPKQLFEKYHRNYKLWWSKALEKTQNLLSSKKNATLFCFDIKSYYHSVEIDFKLIEENLTIELQMPSNRRIFELLLMIHIYYKPLIYNLNPSSVTKNEDRFPLPIGLSSSFVIANYFLKDIDNLFESTSPKYYGRYVDDVILVYEGINRQKKLNKINSFISTQFPNILQITQNDNYNDIRFVDPKYSNLQIQNEKINLYEFTHKSSPSILPILIEDQRKKSSEFRFLSDIMDGNFNDFEGLVFERNFDFEEGNKAKFKDVNENKFKIAAYLSKITQRVICHGDKYKSDEIKKVFKFFNGKYLLRYYFFWEKLLTLYWVSGNYKYFNSTITIIQSLISSSEINSKWNIELSLLNRTLNDYLNITIILAQILTGGKDDKLSPYKKMKILPRDHYAVYPFLPYTKAFTSKSINLLDHNCLDKFKSDPDQIKVIPKNVPTGKPFYWCYLATYFYYAYKEKIIGENQSKILDEAFILYTEINRCLIPKSDLFSIAKINDKSSPTKIVFEITGKYPENQNKKSCRIAIVNQFVSEQNFSSSLKALPIKTSTREAEIRLELDQISKIRNLDIVVKPELSIPIYSLFNYVQHSAKSQYSLNSGIEYIQSANFANNFILCTLPIKVGGVFSDCIPIIRLKNNYSYEETNKILKLQLHLAVKPIAEFYLFRHKGIFFSNYYCFELTSIENRALFKSMVDLIVAPVWNKDTFYFKAISETFVRDIHCFYAQSNTSQFADSRMIQPTKSLQLVKSLVKGGTIEEPRLNFTTIIDDINLKEFREFQLMNYNETQEGPFKSSNIYKPLPPDFNQDNVTKRINDQSMSND